jgi:serine/threonine protein kinase
MTSRIDNYIYYNKRIGKGSFSRVYKGYKVGYPDKLYAIKKIDGDSENERLKKEIEVMKNIKHPNIIKLYDVCYQDDSIYLILEYCVKSDFSKFLKKRPLKEKYAQKYLLQISSALRYLFEKNIIHRDLKPHNILVTENNDLKISDFGFARYFEKNTLVDTICGSPLYMAPEIMKNKNYNIKSDLWSVGIILYEMLSGKTPFKVKTFYNLIKNIDKNPIEFPKNIKISDECNDLLFKLLKKNPDERIEWEDFFNHNWLKNIYNTDSIIIENKMMDFSINDSFPRLSILEEKKHNNIFLEYDSDEEETKISFIRPPTSKPIDIPNSKKKYQNTFSNNSQSPYESIYDKDYIIVEHPSDEETPYEDSILFGNISSFFSNSINMFSQAWNNM